MTVKPPQAGQKKIRSTKLVLSITVAQPYLKIYQKLHDTARFGSEQSSGGGPQLANLPTHVQPVENRCLPTSLSAKFMLLLRRDLTMMVED
jgi:hypothetical protein